MSDKTTTPDHCPHCLFDKFACACSEDRKQVTRLETELAAAREALEREQEANWTASLCDRVNDFLREHPVCAEVRDGQECSGAIQWLHGHAGSLRCERDSLRAEVENLKGYCQQLKEGHSACDADNQRLRARVAELEKAGKVLETLRESIASLDAPYNGHEWNEAPSSTVAYDQCKTDMLKLLDSAMAKEGK